MNAASLDTLPEGVVDEILEAIQGFDTYTVRRTLCSLCRVSRNLLLPARRELYRSIDVEHASDKPVLECLRRTVSGHSDTAGLIRRLSVSTTLGGTSRSEASHSLAILLRDILVHCPRLEEIRYAPDEYARTFEATFVRAWSACANLRKFTLVMSQFREIALTPRQPLGSLTLELARDGDWTWEYDYYTRSWPNRPALEVQELRLVKLQFPAYNDQVLVSKLEQITRAIGCPARLYLVSCVFSHKALDVLLGLSPNGWRADKLEELSSHANFLVNGQDKATHAYQLPYLPSLKRLDVKKQRARLILDPRSEQCLESTVL